MPQTTKEQAQTKRTRARPAQGAVRPRGGKKPLPPQRTVTCEGRKQEAPAANSRQSLKRLNKGYVRAMLCLPPPPDEYIHELFWSKGILVWMQEVLSCECAGLKDSTEPISVPQFHTAAARPPPQHCTPQHLLSPPAQCPHCLPLAVTTLELRVFSHQGWVQGTGGKRVIKQAQKHFTLK